MTPTAEQLAIIQFIQDHPTESLIVEALAGTGKTSTITLMCQHIPAPLCLAFNKKAATELEERLPPSAQCQTLNALGHRTISRYLSKRLILNTKKFSQVWREHGSEDYDWGEARRAISAARTEGLVPSGLPWKAHPLIEDTAEQWDRLFFEADVDLPLSAIAFLRNTLREMNRRGFHGEIDFDDQLYLPVVYRMPFVQFDTVIVDEAQDLSPIQHIMVERSTRQRVIAVGDRHQAIYGFRGASYTSLDQLAERFGCHQLPLSTCWRCDDSVLEEARRVVPGIKTRPDAPQGLVEQANALDVSPNECCAIICRNNAPLLSAAYKLLADGVPCQIQGGNLGQQLLKVAKTATAGLHPSASPNGILAALFNWRAAEYERAQEKSNQGIAARAEDRFDALCIMLERCQSLTEFFAEIERMFAPSTAKVILSTIHRAKGLEWDTVYFLLPDLIPNKYSKSRDQLQQEENLRYVGITRARHRLVYVNAITQESGE